MDDAAGPVGNDQHRRQRVHRAQGSGAANGIAASGNRSGVVFNISATPSCPRNSASGNVMNMSDSGVANLKNNIIHTVSQSTQVGNMVAHAGQQPLVRGEHPDVPALRNLRTRSTVRQLRQQSVRLAAGSPAIDSGLNLGAAYATFVMPGANWPNPALAMRPAGASGHRRPLRAPCVSLSAAGRQALPGAASGGLAHRAHMAAGYRAPSGPCSMNTFRRERRPGAPSTRPVRDLLQRFKTGRARVTDGHLAERPVMLVQASNHCQLQKPEHRDLVEIRDAEPRRGVHGQHAAQAPK